MENVTPEKTGFSRRQVSKGMLWTGAAAAAAGAGVVGAAAPASAADSTIGKLSINPATMMQAFPFFGKGTMSCVGGFTLPVAASVEAAKVTSAILTMSDGRTYTDTSVSANLSNGRISLGSLSWANVRIPDGTYVLFAPVYPKFIQFNFQMSWTGGVNGLPYVKGCFATPLGSFGVVADSVTILGSGHAGFTYTGGELGCQEVGGDTGGGIPI